MALQVVSAFHVNNKFPINKKGLTFRQTRIKR